MNQKYLRLLARWATRTTSNSRNWCRFYPKKILDTEILDGTIEVSKDEAFEYAQKAAKLEGLFVGISSGASLAAVAKKIKELPKGSRILTFSYDHGERYFSVDGLF